MIIASTVCSVEFTKIENTLFIVQTLGLHKCAGAANSNSAVNIPYERCLYDGIKLMQISIRRDVGDYICLICIQFSVCRHSVCMYVHV